MVFTFSQSCVLTGYTSLLQSDQTGDGTTKQAVLCHFIDCVMQNRKKQHRNGERGMEENCYIRSIWYYT